MAQVNNTDLVLKALYDRRAHNGTVPVVSKLKQNNYSLLTEELAEIKEKLELTRFAIFKTGDNGKELDGAITQSGIHFVLTNSFSRPGTSILKII